jgi:hypothetical protein
MDRYGCKKAGTFTLTSEWGVTFVTISYQKLQAKNLMKAESSLRINNLFILRELSEP